MRNKADKLFQGTLVMFLLSLFSCATTQPIQQTQDRTINMGYYSVEAPPGEDWQYEMNKEKGILICQKLKKWFSGRVLGSTLIEVFRNSVAPQGWHLNEEECTDDFRNSEERGMQEEGVKKGLYELRNVKKGMETVGDRKLYTMHYETTMTLPGGVWEHGLAARRAQQVVLYLYFPPDFQARHIFYGFLISEEYERGSLVKVDLTQVHPIIRSFKESEETKK